MSSSIFRISWPAFLVVGSRGARRRFYFHDRAVARLVRIRLHAADHAAVSFYRGLLPAAQPGHAPARLEFRARWAIITSSRPIRCRPWSAGCAESICAIGNWLPARTSIPRSATALPWRFGSSPNWRGRNEYRFWKPLNSLEICHEIIAEQARELNFQWDKAPCLARPGTPPSVAAPGPLQWLRDCRRALLAKGAISNRVKRVLKFPVAADCQTVPKTNGFASLIPRVACSFEFHKIIRMRVAHFDCFSGISGDMTLAALIDAGVDVDAIRAGLDSLGLPIKLEIEKVKRKRLPRHLRQHRGARSGIASLSARCRSHHQSLQTDR